MIAATLVAAVSAAPFQFSGTLRAGQTLTVNDVQGTIRVRDGDRLTIHADKHAERSDPSTVQVHVEQRDDGVVVCVRYPPDADRGCGSYSGRSGSSGNDTVVDFEITVPRGTALVANTVNGSVDVQHDGSAGATAVNGSVRIDATQISSAKTVNGGLHLTMRNAERGSLVATTVNGEVDVQLPASQGIAVDARTLTGDISVPGVSVDRPRYGPGARASGTVGDGALRLRLESVNGSITVRR